MSYQPLYAQNPDTSLGPLQLDSNKNLKVSGTLTANQGTSATSALSSVAASVSGVQLLASNTSRKAAYIFNDSTATLYIGMVAHASLSTSNYTAQVPPSTLWEMPIYPIYTGEISGIWSSATGNARITELT